MKTLLSPLLLLLFLPWGLPAVAQTPDGLEHSSVRLTTSEGLSLAAFVSRPKGASAPLPAIFLTQWVSCGSIAPNPERQSTAEQLALAASFALIRLERSGTGESEGPGCDRLDYETEVRHYREALDQLREHDWVRGDHVVIYGSSLGSTTAPLVALDNDIAGVVVQGAGALTYFERMTFFDRLQLERRPDFDPLTIGDEMRRRMEFHRLYLHHRMTPDQIAELRPDLADIWASLRGTDEAPHYGRPYAWHWQAAEQDWLAAWARLDAPVMVVFGKFEQFESRHGHKVIVDTVNRLRPGRATWLELPRTGHSLWTYPDPYAAFRFEGGERGHEAFVEAVAQWLRSTTGPMRDQAVATP